MKQNQTVVVWMGNYKTESMRVVKYGLADVFFESINATKLEGDDTYEIWQLKTKDAIIEFYVELPESLEDTTGTVWASDAKKEACIGNKGFTYYDMIRYLPYGG